MATKKSDSKKKGDKEKDPEKNERSSLQKTKKSERI